MARKRTPSIKADLIRKSREAALNAVQSFNNPLTTFKTEAFIVLMVIAWTYLLHAYYRHNGVEYRYYSKGPIRRKFHRTKSGAFKHWELERCLKENICPLDRPTTQNLRFLIGLRHEIEHHRSAGTDERFSGRYLACCLNYERYICDLFGERYSLSTAAAFTLQFRDLKSASAPTEATTPLPSSIAKYVQEFDAELSAEEIASPHFRCRFLFTPLVTSRKAQADAVIEFVPAEAELGLEINEKYQQVVLKEVERPKYLPSRVVALMQEEGFARFSMHNHTQLWQGLNGKNPGKGYGVAIAGTWYWYDGWVEVVRRHCTENDVLYSG